MPLSLILIDRNATAGHYLGLTDRLELGTNLLAACSKLLYAFLWQVVFDAFVQSLPELISDIKAIQSLCRKMWSTLEEPTSHQRPTPLGLSFYLSSISKWEMKGLYVAKQIWAMTTLWVLLFRDEFTVFFEVFCKSFQNMTWRYANNRTSWDLHISDVQQGVGYPGYAECNPTIPHAKWWEIYIYFKETEDPSRAGWQNLAAFRRGQKWPWKFSSSAYLQFFIILFF